MGVNLPVIPQFSKKWDIDCRAASTD